MKAAVHYTYGLAEVLQIQDIAKPVPQEHEVLIKVYASTVNRTDSAMVMARPFIARFSTGLRRPKSPYSGTEFAGVIEEIGRAATLYKVGDKVFGFNGLGVGTHAEYAVLNENETMAQIPEGISFEQAAASCEGAHYAQNFINKVKIQQGHKILIIGGTGGIGSAMTQLLKGYDVEITAVCQGKDAAIVKGLGAHHIIDYNEEDFTKSTEKYDFVFDAVGKSTFGKCKAVMKANGVYISSELGPWSQNIFFSLFFLVLGPLPWPKIYQKVKFPLPVDRKASLALVCQLMTERKFAPLIDRTYRLEAIKEAFVYVETGQKIGNVVISIIDK